MTMQPLAYQYQASDIIQENLEPFSKVVGRVFKNDFCDNCLKPGDGKLKCCRDCKQMFYCDRKCQNKDWKNGHKIECGHPYQRALLEAEDKAHAEDDEVKMEECHYERQLFRVYALLKLKPSLMDKKVRVEYNDTKISFNDILEKFRSNFDQNHIMISYATKAAAEINKDSNQTVDVKTLVDISVVVNMVTAEVFDESGVHQFGVGCYLQMAAFGISCKPNTHLQAFGEKHLFRAIAPIAVGEQPTICLFGGLQFVWNREDRRRVLLEAYNIDCQCPSCVPASGAEFDHDGFMEDIIKLHNALEHRLSFSGLLELKDKILTSLHGWFHEFDKHMTLVYFSTLTALVHLHVDESQMEARKKFVEDFKRNVSMTYGSDYCQQSWIMKRLDLILGKACIVAISVPHGQPYHIEITEEIQVPDSINDLIRSLRYVLAIADKEDMENMDALEITVVETTETVTTTSIPEVEVCKTGDEDPGAASQGKVQSNLAHETQDTGEDEEMEGSETEEDGLPVLQEQEEPHFVFFFEGPEKVDAAQDLDTLERYDAAESNLALNAQDNLGNETVLGMDMIVADSAKDEAGGGDSDVAQNVDVAKK